MGHNGFKNVPQTDWGQTILPSPYLTSRTVFLSTFLVTQLCGSLLSLNRRASMLDFYFDHSEERPLEAFEDIFASFESKK